MPSSAVQCFTDPWDFQASIRDSNVKAVVMARGEYRATLSKIDLHHLLMQRAEVVLPQITYSAVNKDLNTAYFLADTKQPSISNNGMELSPGTLVFSAPGAAHHRRFSAGCRWGSVALKPDDLAAAGRALVGRDLPALTDTRLIRPPPHLMSRLMHLHSAAGELATTVPDILAHPEVARAIEQELVHVTVQCLADGLTVRTDGSPRGLPVMRLFEQFLEANPDSALHLPEVCAAIGVSDRTLRNHCQDHLGLSPRKYLWLRRMHLARKALVSAESSATTVTAVATDYGFWELGRFATQYRGLFGESPSGTLHRPPK